MICSICFKGTSVKNAKKHKSNSKNRFEIVQDIEVFKNKALEWKSYDHEYSTIYDKIDWISIQKLNAHKNCKSNFYKPSYMSYQNLNPELIPDQKTVDTFVNDDVEMTSPECPRRSRRHEQEYHSSLDDVLCIICNETKKDSHGKIVPVTKMFLKKSGEEVHMVEKQLTDFATLHKDKNTKYETAADRIFLTLSTRDKLFTANVGYHKDCYASFRSPKWKIDKAAQYSEKERHATEFIDLIEYLIVKQKEVYTLVQLRSLYAEIKGVTIEAVRGVDIKSLIEKCLENKVKFCKPTDGSNKISEYAISSDFNILPDTLHAMHTGEGITNYLQVKNISKSISANIKSIPKKSWPPTPQDILKYEEPLDKILYNLIAWIVSPKSSMGKDGYRNN